MEKYKGFVEHVFHNDNSANIRIGDQPYRNYFINRIHESAVTTDSLEDLKEKEVSFVVFRVGDTPITVMIDIVE